jgi:hypothetical protein
MRRLVCGTECCLCVRLSIGNAARIVRRVRRLCRQVTLEQNGGGDTVYRALPFLPADVGGDEQIFRRLGGHPFVPQDERHRQARFQFRRKLAHRLDGRPLAAVQLKR